MSTFPFMFLRNNRDMLGFGSTEQTLAQIVKELVDNAIDSVRLCSEGTGCSVELILDTTEDLCMNESLVKVVVSDSGSGIDFPLTDAMKAFGSTKVNCDRGMRGLSLYDTVAHGDDDDDNDDDDDDDDDKDEENKEEREEVKDAGSMAYDDIDNRGGLPQCGKFGIGLSACLLFSNMDNMAQPLSICTKTSSSRTIKVAKFGVHSKTKLPILLEHHEEEAGLNQKDWHGTIITCYAKVPASSMLPPPAETTGLVEEELASGGPGQIDDDPYQRVLDRIKGYVDMVGIMDTRANLKMIVRKPPGGLGGGNGDSGGGTMYTADAREMTMSVLDSQDPSLCYNDRVQAWVQHKYKNIHNEVQVSTLIQSASQSIPEIEVFCSSVLICTTDEPMAAGLECGGQVQKSLQDTIPLKIVRFFNSSPVLESEDGAVSADCSVVEAATRGLKWSEKFGRRLESSGSKFSLIPIPERGPDPSPRRLYLLPESPTGSSNGDGQSVVVQELLLFVNMIGDLPYSNLRKTALVFSGDNDARNTVAKAVLLSLKGLRSEIVLRNAAATPSPLLASKKEFSKLVRKSYVVPTIATTLTRLLHKNEEIETILGIGGQDTPSISSHTRMSERLVTLLEEAFASQHNET
jgi:hypothetical protein